MTLDRSGTNFKGPRSLSNQFVRFCDPKVVIGHFGRTHKLLRLTHLLIRVISGTKGTMLTLFSFAKNFTQNYFPLALQITYFQRLRYGISRWS